MVCAGARTRITRSGLKIIPGRAGSYFCAAQGERSAIGRVSMSDEQRENAQKWRRSPPGWALKSPLAASPRLEIAPLVPAHGALLSLISGPNAITDNFEAASNTLLND
jgi:hypothetical protein